MPPLSPVLLERRAVPKVWGGRALAEVLGIPVPSGAEGIGETWELFDRPDGSSPIRGAGETLRDLMSRDARSVLGGGIQPTADGRFPLLFKFIDAREQLSIQVHPGPELARRHGDGPKDEAWVVVATGPNARIVRGFKGGVTRADVESAARAGAPIEELVHAFRPKVGDVISVPHGVVHAIGPDVVVYEVQQNSDLTFRLWDWGRPRELHVEPALAALRVGDEGPSVVTTEPIDANASWLIRTPSFRVRRMRFDAPATLGSEGSFKVMTVLNGMAAIGWRCGGEFPPLAARRGDTILVPGAVDVLFVSPIGGLDVLWADAGEGR